MHPLDDKRNSGRGESSYVLIREKVLCACYDHTCWLFTFGFFGRCEYFLLVSGGDAPRTPRGVRFRGERARERRVRTPDSQLGMFIHGLGGGEWMDYAHGVSVQCLSVSRRVGT